MRRGIIIRGIKDKTLVLSICDFAKSFGSITHMEEKVNGRFILSIIYEKDDEILYSIAAKIRSHFKIDAQVKYIKTFRKDLYCPHTKMNRKEWGNPFQKEIKISHIEPSEIIKSPKLRIDLELKNVDELYDFLKVRPINYQMRERYFEQFLDNTKTSKSNDSNRSTFVAKNVVFDKDNVEVYVNGRISSEICCHVEEKSDAYILHLFHKGARHYYKSIAIRKDDAKEPLRRFTYNEEQKKVSVNGRGLTLTFEGYDAYKRHRHSKETVHEDKENTVSIKYEGKPIHERRTSIMSQTEVITGNDTIIVHIKEEYADNNIVQAKKSKAIKQERGVVASSETNISQIQFSDTVDDIGTSMELTHNNKEQPYVKPKDIKPVYSHHSNNSNEDGKYSQRKEKRKKGWFARLFWGLWEWYHMKFL